ncbi:MAG: hypothetical protein IPL46_24545 [Saprospiraceae bacterium]|nr:hypothetical protein [Saprospiraceae bacterium]
MSKKIADRLRDPLEDQGWQQMKVLLNREMPESKRRMIWWPLMGAAATVVLLLLGYQYIFNNTEQTLLTGNSTSDSPDLSDKAQTKGHPEVVLDSIPSNSDFAESTTFKSSNASTSHQPAIKKNQNQKEKSSSINHGMLANHRDKRQDNNPEYEDKKGVEGVTVLENPSPFIEPEINDYVDPQGRIETESRSLSPIASSLSSLKYIYPIHRNEWFEPMTIEHIIDAPRDPLVDFSLATGMLTDNSVSKPSFDLGGQIRLKPSGKIAIGLGSFFWSINSNQTFSAVSSPTNSFNDSKDFSLSADQGIQRADSVSVPCRPQLL